MRRSKSSPSELEEPGHALDMSEEQTSILYMQAPISNIALAVIATIFLLILLPRIESNLPGYWVIAMYAGALYRLSLWYRRNTRPDRKSPRQWMNHYALGCGLVGVSWSLIYPLIYSANDLIVSVVLAMLFSGTTAAAVPILAISMRAFVGYTYPQAFIFGYTLLQFQESSYRWLAFGLCVYLLMITLFTFNSNRSLKRSIRLQIENRELIGELGREIDQREELIEQRTIQLHEKNSDLVAEIGEREQAEVFLAGQKKILELISRGIAPLSQILDEIIRFAESQAEDMRGSILLLEGSTLRYGVAPNLPDAYNAKIDGMEIGPKVLSCGTAAFRGERVIVEDVRTDPLWAGYRQLGIDYGFTACWSEPVIDPAGKVLGTVAFYHDTPIAPDTREIRLLETTAQIAAIAIERSKTEKRLRQSAAVFQSTLEGVMITDADRRILDVNKAFERITGYSRDEVVGRTPRVLQSGKQDPSFYREMWASLKESGQWRGEIWNRRKDGIVYPEWISVSSIQDNNGETFNYVAVFSDITSIKRAEEELDHLAHHDSLTDLPNRLLFYSRLEQALERAKRRRSVFAVLFVDLDRFKNINDSLGHKSGDELLQGLAVRISEKVRLDDTVARVSGDEFVLLLEDVENAQNAAVAVEKIMEVFDDPFRLDGHEVRITASIGISLYPSNGDTVATLMRNADAAMYHAKDDGRNTYHFYTDEMTSSAFERVVMENALRVALERSEFHLLYQPQVKLSGGELVGVEALIRWRHPQLGETSPSRFIPLAEESGLIRDIGEWVLRTACAQGRRWIEAGFEFGRISVNVARLQLQQPDFVEKVKAILEAAALPADKLELEITERNIMQNVEQAVHQLEALRVLGLRLAIDDFGTGYSSMSYLKLLPIQKLKIDKSFVRDIPFDANDMAISQAVIALGNALDLEVVAEGVETDQQAEFLRRKGCREGQGYFFCRPVSVDELEAMYSIGEP